MISNWKKFNELKSSTYRNASDKLNKMGHKKRAQDLKSHAEDMMVVNSRNKYGIDECSFLLNNGEVIKGKFAGFDFGQSYDMFSDDGSFLSIPLYFFFGDKLCRYGSRIYNVFTIGYEVEKSRIYVDSYDEDIIQEVFGQSSLYFSNRKDANKIITVLRSIDIDNEFSRFNVIDEFVIEFKRVYGEMLKNLSTNQLFRT